MERRPEIARRPSPKVCIVTGANTGIGKETVHALVHKGFHIVLACRSLERGQAAVEDIKQTLFPQQSQKDADCKKKAKEKEKSQKEDNDQNESEEQTENVMEVLHLDLSDLDSVRSFAKEFKARYDQLHVLVLNAGTLFLSLVSICLCVSLFKSRNPLTP